MLPADAEGLVAAVVAGDRRALARLITSFESSARDALPALKAAFGAASPSRRIGVTGAPGSGKSTLVDGLIGEVRRSGSEVAVLAVDPSSPFTGGAVLGDRVRMQDHALDEGVFVRSMASRGHLGGLAAAAPKALLALEAAGFPVVLIETVGVGQDEVEVAAAADTVVVVVTPGWGDGVQAAKAGILEVGDVFVVNKADRAGASEAKAELQAMLQMGPATAWTPPIVETVAIDGKGVAEVWEAVNKHREHLGLDGLELRRRGRRHADFETALAVELRLRAATKLASSEGILESVENGEIDPWSAAEAVLG